MQQVLSNLKSIIINYEIIINELREDFNQKGIFEKDYIQLFKQRILLSKYKALFCKTPPKDFPNNSKASSLSRSTNS